MIEVKAVMRCDECYKASKPIEIPYDARMDIAHRMPAGWYVTFAGIKCEDCARKMLSFVIIK